MNEELFDAIEFAARAHRGQLRKGSQLPYLVHPLSAACILIEHEVPNPIVIAAILHDTVEDTGVDLGAIEGVFGKRVAALVDQASEPDRSASWEERKRHTIEFIESSADDDALLIVCADKLDNIRSTRKDLSRHGPAVWERFNRPEADQAWYYRALVAALGRRMVRQPGRDLHQALAREVDRVFGSE